MLTGLFIVGGESRHCVNRRVSPEEAKASPSGCQIANLKFRNLKSALRKRKLRCLLWCSAQARIFPRRALQKFGLQAPPRHRLIAFAPEGSPLDRGYCE